MLTCFCCFCRSFLYICAEILNYYVFASLALVLILFVFHSADVQVTAGCFSGAVDVHVGT